VGVDVGVGKGVDMGVGMERATTGVFSARGRRLFIRETLDRIVSEVRLPYSQHLHSSRAHHLSAPPLVCSCMCMCSMCMCMWRVHVCVRVRVTCVRTLWCGLSCGLSTECPP
jgi:hypothetical protein